MNYQYNGRKVFVGYMQDKYWEVVKANSNSFADVSLADVFTPKWGEVKQILKNNKEVFFTDFADVSLDDRIIGAKPPKDDGSACYFNIVTFQRKNTEAIPGEKFTDDGLFDDQILWGLEESLNSVNNSDMTFTYVDEISIVPEYLFTDKQKELYCEIVEMYSKDNSFERYYLQLLTGDKNYNHVSSLLMEYILLYFTWLQGSMVFM